MQEMSKDTSRNDNGAGGERQGADGKAKPIGPSKEMVAALKAQGLNIVWSEDIYAPIKGTFFTKTRPTEEKHVEISLDCFKSKGLATPHQVDGGIALELYSIYMQYNWELEANRSPEPTETIDELVRLYEDKQEEEKMLCRFHWVAEAVMDCHQNAASETWQSPFDEDFRIKPEIDAKIESSLERTCPKLVPGSGIWNSLIAPLACSQEPASPSASGRIEEE